jgi:hypothetical protein
MDDLTEDASLLRSLGKRVGLATHAIQYAISSSGRTFYNTESIPTPRGVSWSRFNRCPNCEEWSPCKERQALLKPNGDKGEKKPNGDTSVPLPPTVPSETQK